ncbi:MAG: PKD domain-containing protein [Bacteroidetes bacterium]|nr:PKD domain-containing protein [Bacteroidota bacterium]MBS1540524.1 PKD domain-containing protein [Bacteroidota bacterium]
MNRIFFFCCIGLWPGLCLGQCPTPVFSMQSSLCSNQKVSLANSSTNALNYEWDFCTGDFNNSPTANLSFNLPSGGGRPGIELVKTTTGWFGFDLGIYSNTLYRLQYTNGVSKPATIVENLGNPNGKLNNPGQIRVIEVAGQWYGFILNVSSNEILMLSFGNNLSNNFTISTIVSNIPALSFSSGLSLGYDTANGWVCVVTLAANNLYIVRLGSNLSSPIASDIITSSLSVPVSLAYGIGDIDLVNDCGTWYGFMNNYGSGHVFRVDFGASLFSDPSAITMIYHIPVSNLGRLRMARDGINYFLFVASIDNVFSKLQFGSDLTSTPTLVNEGNINNSISSVVYGLSITKDNSVWVIHAADASGNVYQIYYPNICSASPASSTIQSPQVSYSASGNFQVALTATNSFGSSVITQAVNVSSTLAPDISFSTQNICANANVNFTATNLSGNITSYAWTFGDGGTSTASSPAYSYTSAGTYHPSLTVTANNGCQNTAIDTLQIFNPPQANFLLPGTSPVCTNQNYFFSNTSTSDTGSNPTWQWSVNGSAVSTNQNLSYTLASASAQTIKLVASIPGCSTQSVQTIGTVLTGPAVGFNAPATGCAATPITFTNTTSGSVTAYTWAFGDGNTSTLTSTSNTYASTGTYAVTLNATNAAGCNNSFSKNISIYSNPKPKFSIEAPPFSCANYPAQFDNNTGFLTDSNVTSWQWTFGDAANGTSTQKSPAYTYTAAGSYSVGLKATTNFGCTATKDSVITILASPQAGFTNSVACQNQNTQFTNASTGSITSYNWYFPGATVPVSGASPPPFMFTSAGANAVTLSVTATNGCINSITKSINVPVPPVLDFSIQYPCTRNATIFQELNPGGNDPTVSWSWNFGSASGAGSPVRYLFTSSGGYGVTLTTTRQSGCIYSVTKNVSIYDGPVASFTPSVLAGAAPLSVTFNNTSSAVSSLWQFGDAANSTSTVTSPAFIYTQLGEYKAALTASNAIGCTDTTSVWISVVIPRPNATLKVFSLTANPATNTSQPFLTVFNSGNVPLVNPEVDIDLGGGGIIKQTLPAIIQPKNTFSQTLNLPIVSSALTYVCAQVVVPQDVNPESSKQCISLEGDVVFNPYPNPTSGMIHLDWIATTVENVDVTIFKSDGEVVFQQSLPQQAAGLTQFSLITSSLANGLYLIRFSGATVQKTFRFVVAN